LRLEPILDFVLPLILKVLVIVVQMSKEALVERKEQQEYDQVPVKL